MIRGLSALTALLARALSIDLPACVPSRRTEKKTYLSIYIRRQGARRIARAVSANSANRSTAIGGAHHIAQARAGIGGVPISGWPPEFCQSLKGGSELRPDNLACARDEDAGILRGSTRGGEGICLRDVCAKPMMRWQQDHPVISADIARARETAGAHTASDRTHRARLPAHLWGSMRPVSRTRNEGFQWLAH